MHKVYKLDLPIRVINLQLSSVRPSRRGLQCTTNTAINLTIDAKYSHKASQTQFAKPASYVSMCVCVCSVYVYVSGRPGSKFPPPQIRNEPKTGRYTLFFSRSVRAHTVQQQRSSQRKRRHPITRKGAPDFGLEFTWSKARPVQARTVKQQRPFTTKEGIRSPTRERPTSVSNLHGPDDRTLYTRRAANVRHALQLPSESQDSVAYRFSSVPCGACSAVACRILFVVHLSLPCPRFLAPQLPIGASVLHLFSSRRVRSTSGENGSLMLNSLLTSSGVLSCVRRVSVCMLCRTKDERRKGMQQATRHAGREGGRPFSASYVAARGNRKDRREYFVRCSSVRGFDIILSGSLVLVDTFVSQVCKLQFSCSGRRWHTI